MADYQLRQNGPTVQQAIDTALEIQTDLAQEVERAQGAEALLATKVALAAEVERATGAEALLATAAALSSEVERAGGAETALGGRIDGVEAKIPTQASAANQLADKAWVNSTVGTATATFRGTYNLVSDLSLAVTATHAQIEAALGTAIATRDNNDYCFVQIPTKATKPTQIASVERYKFNGTAWAFEYVLNNSSFTEAQWEAINSTITSALVGKLDALPTNEELQTALNGKQATLTFDETPTASSNNPVKSKGIKSYVDTALGDYYTKQQTYNKDEMDTMLADKSGNIYPTFRVDVPTMLLKVSRADTEERFSVGNDGYLYVNIPS